MMGAFVCIGMLPKNKQAGLKVNAFPDEYWEVQSERKERRKIYIYIY